MYKYTCSRILEQSTIMAKKRKSLQYLKVKNNPIFS